MLSYHILTEGDGAERLDGVRGVVTSNDALNYRVRWEDGASTDHERGDPDVWGFSFPQSQGRPSGFTYNQIRNDHRQWAAAGPRPAVPSQDTVIPIEADHTRYGYPDGPERERGRRKRTR
jgi:hypothetical protein